MTYHSAEAKAGPALYAAALAGVVCAILGPIYVVSMLCFELGSALLRDLGSVSVDGLLVAAPIAIGASLVVRCHACDRLVLPFVYDGKSFFSARSASALAISKAALSVVFQRRTPCPHCGAEAEV